MCSVRPCGRLSLTCEGGRAAVTALSASPPCLPGSPCHQSHLQQPPLSAPGNDPPLTPPSSFRRMKVLTLVVSFSFLVWSTLYCVLLGCCLSLAFPLSPFTVAICSYVFFKRSWEKKVKREVRLAWVVDDYVGRLLMDDWYLKLSVTK